MSEAVSACHVQDLAEMLAALAAKLGASPEIEVVEEALKIIIEGVSIEQEIALACEDFADSNWVGFGFELAKLIKTLA